MKELEGYVAKFECLTCGGKWSRRWRDDPQQRDYGIGPSSCPRNPEHHYIKWVNWDEFRKLYAPIVRLRNANEGNV